MKRQLAQFAVRNHKHPAFRAAVDLIEGLNLKEPLTRMLFEGDTARRPIVTAGDPVDPVARVHAHLRRVASSDKPIIIGPWLSEVGFELLYWTPFLRWAIQHFRIDQKRITVISRGGVKGWYSGICGNYLDVFDAYAPDEYRELNERRWLDNAGLQKHTAMSSFDAMILEKFAGHLGDCEILHPELMYLLFDDHWSGLAGSRRYTDHVKVRALKKPAHPILAALPETYTAVKFYERASFPMTEESRAFVRDFTLRLAEETPVVFITTDVKADDHGDYGPPGHPNVITVNECMTPSDNLLVQSAIIAGASRVFCTYGGFAYLPLLYGVPTVGVYSVDKHFLKIHGCAAYRLAFNLKTPLSVSHISAFSLAKGEKKIAR